MSQNCKSQSCPATRDANNNTLYHATPAQGYNSRGYPPPYNNNAGLQQMSANVLFSSVTSIGDLKIKEAGEREARRTH